MRFALILPFLLFIAACTPRPAILLPQGAAQAKEAEPGIKTEFSGRDAITDKTEPKEEVEEAPATTPLKEPEPSPEKLASQQRAKELYQAAHDHYLHGRYDAAQELLGKATNEDPDLAKAYILLSKILLMEGTVHNDKLKLEAARQMLSLALELEPSNPESQALLALISQP